MNRVDEGKPPVIHGDETTLAEGLAAVSEWRDRVVAGDA